MADPLIFDGTPIEVDGTETILQAARRIGVEIPTMCYIDGAPPMTSCMVCLVKVNGGQRLLPACATVPEPEPVADESPRMTPGDVSNAGEHDPSSTNRVEPEDSPEHLGSAGSDEPGEPS